jgi:hypothetical protein
VAIEVVLETILLLGNVTFRAWLEVKEKILAWLALAMVRGSS